MKNHRLYWLLPILTALPIIATASLAKKTRAETKIDAKIPGVAMPACAEETQLALNRCAARWSKTAEFLRSLIYQDLSTQVSAETQTRLVASDQTWQSYREIHCQELSEPFQEGSIYPLLYHSCLARITNDRIADLQSLGETTMTATSTAQLLTKVLSQANSENSPGQRQWQRYRNSIVSSKYCSLLHQHSARIAIIAWLPIGFGKLNR